MLYRDPRRRIKRNRAGNLFEEIISENFPNMGKKTDLEIQEAQRISNKINPRRSIPRHKVIKMAKSSDKERIFKVGRGNKTVTYKRNPIRLPADFPEEILQARKEWHDIFKVLKGVHNH